MSSQETPKDTQKELGKVIDINAKKKVEAKKPQLTADGQIVQPYITLNIVPVAKPRMTQSDKWKKRPVTDRYWLYKRELKILCHLCRWTPRADLDVKFVIPMPTSWSEKKRVKMDGQPHQQRPDLDNLVKGFKDALLEEDSHVHTYNNMSKVWGRNGAIIVKR